LLKYAIEALLVEANPSGAPFFRQTHLYKALFLLHQNLKRRNIDLGLPYCWYLHGPLIEATAFEEQTGTPLTGYLQPDGATASVRHAHDAGLTEGEKQVVLKEIQKVLGKYRNGAGWEEGYGDRLIGEAYKLAPFPYQRTFKREYIDYLATLSNEPQFYDYAYDQISRNLLRYLDTLIKQFPENEMSDLLDTYLVWDDTARLFVETREPLDELSNQYWGIFCSLLRVRKNENVPAEIIERWERIFTQDLPIYDQNLETVYEDALGRLERDQTHTPDPEIDPIVRRLMVYARDSAAVRPREM
jgi:hypothetical protein